MISYEHPQIRAPVLLLKCWQAEGSKCQALVGEDSWPTMSSSVVETLAGMGAELRTDLLSVCPQGRTDLLSALTPAPNPHIHSG